MNLDNIQQGNILELRKGISLTIKNSEDKYDTHKCSRLRVKVEKVNRASIRVEVIGISPIIGRIKSSRIPQRDLSKFREFQETNSSPVVFSSPAKPLTYDSVVANVVSRTVLECTEDHTMKLFEGFVNYKAGDRLPRHRITLDSSKWRLPENYGNNENI